MALPSFLKSEPSHSSGCPILRLFSGEGWAGRNLAPIGHQPATSCGKTNTGIIPPNFPNKRKILSMKRLAAVAVMIAGLSCVAFAQRGGFHGGFSGSRGGFSGSHMGFSGARTGFAGRRFVYTRARAAVSPYGFGNPYLPYDSGAAYADDSQPGPFDQQPLFVQPPAPPPPPTVRATGHPVILEYTWPAETAASSPSAHSTTSDSEPLALAIVLKDGSTLSAVSVFASDDGLHYVDPDERHLLISMSAIDRQATLKINHAKNLNLYLPAAQ